MNKWRDDMSMQEMTNEQLWNELIDYDLSYNVCKILEIVFDRLARVEELEHHDELWREKKAMLENDLASAWAKNKELEKEIERLENEHQKNI